MNDDATDTMPKHLRVGVNAAMVEHSAVVKLLIDKGILTNEEYFEALANAMEVEVARYERLLSDRLGTVVKLA